MDSSASTLKLKKQKPAAKTDGEDTKDKDHTQQPADQFSIPDPYKDAEFWPLSEKPFFHVTIPRNVSEKFPHGTVPAKIIYKGKVWDMGDISNQKKIVRIENQKWGEFATDNNLAVGDVCVFELTECSYNSISVQFKVQILKENFPTELLENAPGFTMDNPISLD